MKETKIEFISDGFHDILCSDGVKELVTETASRIQSEANAGIEGESEGFSNKTWMGGYGGGRWVASVSTTDKASIIAESENKALSKAVH